MGFYKSPEDMYTSRAERFKRDADCHWAMAKAGQGDYHYGKAKACYEQVNANLQKAAQARAVNASFGERK